MKRLFILTFFCLLWCASVAVAFENNQIDQTLIETLANDPVWLKLLHFEKGGKKSEILTENFFLSPKGRFDPKSELIATIEAYFKPWPQNYGTHPRCRFPARYFWLSQKIGLPDYSLHITRCKSLEIWSLLNNIKSISIFLVSGYLGNPASVFGHSLLKLNTHSVDDESGLFDVSINYGALIPENVATLGYIVRGITGGYQAGFSDKYFYTQDLVYSRTEFRDMWEYELLLSDYARTLVVLHLWEIIGKKFVYYFLDKNCAFRIAELLEVVIEEPLLENARAWYVPVEKFFRLEEIDKVRREKGKPGLIKSIRFHPSSQRKLYHQFSQLNRKEKKAVEAIVDEGPSAIVKKLSHFKQASRIEIVDTVLAYYKYRLVAQEPSPSIEMNEIKDQVLLARLRLPVQTKPIPQVPELASPAKGNRPMLMGAGAAHDSIEGTYLKIHWSPFSQNIVGQNSLEGDELVLLDTAIGIGGNHNSVFIDTFDVIRIRKFKTDIMALDDESPWSWQLRVGARLSAYEDKSKYDGLFSFGAGRAWKLNNTIIFYAMTDVSAHTIQSHARLRPHVGIIAGKGSVRSWWYAGVETNNYNGDFDAIWGGQVQCKLSVQFALFLSIANDKTRKTSIEFRWYW
jgi:hypothetical protein